MPGAARIPQGFMAMTRCAGCPFGVRRSNNTKALAVVLKREEMEISRGEK